MNRPNIIMMISHDTGRYMGCYDKQVKTPAIDRLANEGLRFDNYFCPAPQCSPSRGSINTGRYPHNNGLIGLTHLGFNIDVGTPTLPGEIGKAGYESVLIGFHHEQMGDDTSPHALGYEKVELVPGDRAFDVAERTEDFLREKADSSSSRPFFASVGFFETHRAFDEYESDGDIEIPKYLPDTEKVRQDMAQFHGSIQSLDRAVDHITRVLEETGMEKNTLLIYTTDHGIAFPRAKGTLLDPGLETALVMRWPTVFGEGRVLNELLCNVDLMPTLLELAEADIPEGMDGRSFLPLLKGETEQTRDSFFCELTWHDLYHPMRGIRTKRYKYIRNLEAGPSVYLPLDVHQSLSGQEVRDQFYVPNQSEELYDLEKDPLEKKNLAKDESYSQVLEDLREQVNNWMQETGDPLLKGPVAGKEAPEWAIEREKE